MSGLRRSRWVHLLSTAAVLGATAACSVLPGTPKVTSAPVAPSSSVAGASSTVETPTPSATDSALPTPGESATSPATPGASAATPSNNGADPSATGAPPVLDQTAAGRDLKVADLFAVPIEWHDGTFDVGSQRGLAGLSGPLRACSEDEAKAQTVELRLANNFSKVALRVGQANNSESSDADLVVRVVGNGTTIDSTRVRFNQLQDLSFSVSGVNALKIEFFMAGKKCNEDKSVNAVVTGLRLA